MAIESYIQSPHLWTRIKKQASNVNKLLILICLCAALYLPGISNLPATDRDESRYMQASKQMLASGDMIDIRFQPKELPSLGSDYSQLQYQRY